MSGINKGRRLVLGRGMALAAASAAPALMLGRPARAAGQTYNYSSASRWHPPIRPP